MDKRFLEECLAKGMSLPQISWLSGRSVGTVGYWVKRHGLVANGSSKYRPGKGLSRESLEPLVNKGLCLGQIATRLQVSINTVRYWIDRHELPKPKEVRAGDRAARLRTGDTRAIRTCRHHGEVEFVLDNRGGWRCRRCRQNAVAERRRKIKRILVEEAGGACRACGYDRCLGALQFHHIDPDSKRFTISHKGNTAGINAARSEARKCVLLCANCHAEVELGLRRLPER